MSQIPIRFRVIRLLLPLVLGLTMVPVATTPTLAAADVIGSLWVDATSGSDTNPGTSTEPFKTITHALASSAASDTIVVQPGTYDAANGEVFPLRDYGASLIGAQGPEVTIIAGDGTSGLLTGEYFERGDTISGLTFTGGGIDTGSGVSLHLGSPTGPGSPLIENNVFDGNASSYFGGGLALFATGPGPLEPLVRGNVFRDNSAEQGGAVTLIGAVSATFLDNVFEGNSAYIAGALLMLTSESTITVEHNDFLGNDAFGSVAGAIYMGATGAQSHSISGNTFAGDHAAYDGGALYLASGNITVAGNDSTDDSAEGFGGFARIGSAVVAAHNNAILSARAHEGGAGWHVTDGTLTERNDTVADCVSSPSVATGDPEARIDIANSIYWNPDVVVDIQRADSVSYSCVSDELVADPSRTNLVGAGVIGTDPLRAAPGDVTLLLGSPCVDTADLALAPPDDIVGTLRPQDGDADSIALPDMGCFEWAPEQAPEQAPEPPIVPDDEPVPPEVTLAGADRYATSAAIATETFDSSEVAILASGRNFPDALSAAGLAGSYDAPLLLTDPDTLPPAISDALLSLGVREVYVVGGTAAVSDTVFEALVADYAVTRISGADRYATSARVGETVAAHEGAAFTGHVFLARGDRFPDALSVAPLAYSSRVPVLLTRTSVLSPVTASALEALDIESATVVGGTNAVSDDTRAALDRVLVANGGTPSERWYGANRYATAAAIAAHGIENGMASWSRVGIATGQNYPDALSGGVRMGHEGGVLLLTETSVLSDDTQLALNEHAEEIEGLDVFGGVAAVSDAVRVSIDSVLGW